MQKFMIRLTTAVAVLAFGLGAAHAQVVISQVYGGGGNAGATYKNDFIELHNNTGSAVSVDGWSVQYASSSGTSWQVTNLAGSIAPGAYYLVQETAGSGGSVDLPTPDATGSISMSGNSGKVALVAATTALSGACPTGNLDFVGYGSANCAEGSAPTPALSSTTAALRAGGGCVDSNENAADFGTGAPNPRNSVVTPNVCNGGGLPIVSISDLSAAEGDEGTTTFLFTLSLNQPAGPEGVTVQYTIDGGGTATAGYDFIEGGGFAPFLPGETSRSLVALVLGDTTQEADETFFVNLTGIKGGLLGDAQAVGTIVNDDFNLVPIHAIQGAGDSSPLLGQTVATSGIVTAVRNAGFFLQAPDAEADANPLTSEGIYVYTGAAPPAAVAVGNRVNVQGTVQEYVPSQDPNQPPLTELGGSPSVLLVSGGNPLPTSVALTTTFPDPAGVFDQLERLEGMRVTAASLTVNTPTLGNVNETSATATSNGVFHAVVTGVPRAYRKPGVQQPDPLPAGSPAGVPRWNTSPEVVAVSSGALGGDRVDVAADCLIVGGSATGPLDYSYRRYTIYPESTLQVDCSNGADQPKPALAPTADDVSVASFNMERFFDDVNDPAIGEPVLSPTAYQGRLNKASLAIRDYLHAPDIVATEEVENLSVLQDVAARVNADAVAAGQADPQYVAYLEEGNDVGGIDVGFLVKTADAAAGMPRVEVLGVTQFGKATTWVDPAGNTALLNDRPPLVLQAVVHFNDRRRFPLTAIAVHQRSLNGVDEDSANGERVRAKRQKQAEFLANLVQARQAADPSEHIMVLGDFNAFEFNDGYVDAMGTVTGLPSADDATVVPGDGVDLVNPDLYDLTFLQPPEVSYSYAFDGNVQSLDHILVNAALMDAGDLDALAVSHARIDADFPETARNDTGTPTRLSDHDPTVVLLSLKRSLSADLKLEVLADPVSVQPGETATFFVNVQNAGPDPAAFAAVAFVFDQAVTPEVFAFLGWTCAPPQITTTTIVTCTIDKLLVDDGLVQTFALKVKTNAAQAGSTLTMAASITSQTPDPTAGNNTDSAVLTIGQPYSADLSASLLGTNEMSRIGGYANYHALIENLGPDSARNPQITITSDLSGTRTSLRSADITLRPPQTWKCIVLSVAPFEATCSDTEPLVSEASAFVIVTIRTLGKLSPDQFELRMSVDSALADPVTENNTSTLEVRVKN